MARNLRKFNTYNDYETAELVRPAVSLVVSPRKVYFDPLNPTPPTPTGSTCYEVIPQSISAYSSTTYDSVYSCTDGKWYMLNNLNDYEEYGIYETGSSLSSFTYYPNKLVAVGTTEYQRSGDTWVVVGTYESSEVSYPINDSNLDDYVGMEMSTTFKIPVADVEALGGWLDLRIMTSDGVLAIDTDQYRYFGSDFEEGTVTNDGTYYNYSLPTTESITIQRINYWNSDTIHIIVGGMQASVEYSAKTAPSSTLYSSIAEMEEVGCPNVGIGDYAFVGKNLYKYSEDGWNGTSLLEPKLVVFYENKAPKLEYPYAGGTDITSQQNTNPIEVYIGSGATTIGGHVCCTFNNCYNLSSVTIADTVTTIGDESFNSCSGLTSITIPNSVTTIGSNAFQNCSGLTSIDIPSGVAITGDRNFQNCTSLTSVTIGNGVTINGENTFLNCNSLPVEDNLRYADTYLVEAVDKTLSTYTIKNDVKWIGVSAFTNCSSLTSIVIPSGVTTISSNAFQNCISLTNINIPSGVTSIGISTFRNCANLTSIDIPSGVTSIGMNAFTDCNGITSIDIPSGVTSINGWTFQNCISLSSIVIPSGVRNIGNSAFQFCSSLTSVTCLATTPPTLGSFVFDNTNNCPIYVPSESVDAYKSASGWSKYASRIQAIPNS